MPILGRHGGQDLHLAMARTFWLEDRLAPAAAAMEKALRAGLPPGHIHDLQRTIEAELGARRAGSILRIDEDLLVEATDQFFGTQWPEASATLVGAVHEVGDLLGARWGAPVLVTIVPDEEWVLFVHARYGYYRRRAPWHKVCLPPSASWPLPMLRRAARHEIAHAAIHQLAGDGVPRWLDEGIAVLAEGGVPADERRRYAISAAKGATPGLEAISGQLEGYEVDLGTGAAALCYAAAADFTGRLVTDHGWPAMGRVLRRVGVGESADRAMRRELAVDRRRAEREWLRGTRG